MADSKCKDGVLSDTFNFTSYIIYTTMQFIINRK